VLFTLSSMLGQSARIYLTAEVLNVVMHDQLVWLAAHLGLTELAWAIILLSGVSVIWTMIGGMATVIWTDVVLFLAFLVGAIVALFCVAGALSGGFAEMFQVGWSATQSGVPWTSWGTAQTSGPWGKFTFFDFSSDPTRAYTIWTAMIASAWGNIGAYGTDQLMAQRMFCCRNVSDARKAMIASWLSNSVTVLVALVGIGLFAYYQSHTPGPEALSLLSNIKNGDRIFPVFIVEVIPVGLKGLIIAAIFAAAISSIMGVLTALSQTVQSAFYNPWREAALRRRGIHIELAASAEHASESAGDPRGAQVADAEARRSVLVGRLLVLFWTIVLSLMAFGAQFVAAHYASLLDMGLAMAQYCGGALLAGFFLGFLPLRIDGRGYLWSAPLSVACIFAIVWHYDWAVVTCWIIGGILLAAWILMAATQRPEQRARNVLPLPAQAVAVVLGIALLIALAHYGYFARTESPTGAVTYTVLAWPWYGPAGSLIAFIWGWLLASKRGETPVARN
jgi:hypothetical protein